MQPETHALHVHMFSEPDDFRRQAHYTVVQDGAVRQQALGLHSDCAPWVAAVCG